MGSPEGLRQRGLHLGVLRPLQEPLGQVVLDGGVRQQDEDARIPATHRRPGILVLPDLRALVPG